MLRRALRSVMNQTYQAFEVIVVDDGSELELRAADLIDPGWRQKVTIVRNERSLGAAAARNRGIRAACGEYVSFLDDDDEFFPDFLEKTAMVLSGTPESIGFSWTNVKFINDAGSRSVMRGKEFREDYASDEELVFEATSIGTGFGVTVKRACFAKVGYFDPSLRFVEDTEFFIRLLASGLRPVLVKTFGVCIHNHDLDRLTSTEKYPQRLVECDLLMEKHEDFLNRHQRVLARLSMVKTAIHRRIVRTRQREAVRQRWGTG